VAAQIQQQRDGADCTVAKLRLGYSCKAQSSGAEYSFVHHALREDLGRSRADLHETCPLHQSLQPLLSDEAEQRRRELTVDASYHTNRIHGNSLTLRWTVQKTRVWPPLFQGSHFWNSCSFALYS